MRKTLILVSFILCGCVPSQQNKGTDQSETIAVTGWQSGEVEVRKHSPVLGDFSYRQGRTPSGMFYRTYSDNTGWIGRSADGSSYDWSVACRIDKMNDNKDCEIFAKRSPILIDYKFSSTPQIVCVQGHDFPGRTAMIRIDGNEPIHTSENGCVSAPRLMGQLKNGAKVATRKTHWPYDENRDEEGDLVGLNDAMQLLEYLRSNIQKPK